MKKLVLLVMVMGLSTVAMAKSHGPAGCGLGQLLFKDKDGLLFNVLAATFNGSSGNQTFGMSTGTLGCEDAQTAKVTAVSFVEANRVALANDVARGGGDTLQGYLQIVNKKDVDASKLQKNFAQIFSTEKSAEQVHHAILANI